jgi:hypothetical protein
VPRAGATQDRWLDLLPWIGIPLLLPEDGEAGGARAGNLMSAIRTILVADLVGSLDNVLAVAAAAKGNLALLIFRLAISIPLVVFGVGKWLARRMEAKARKLEPMLDLAGEDAGGIRVSVVLAAANMPKLLLPTDGSAASDRAVEKLLGSVTLKVLSLSQTPVPLLR